MQTSTEAARVLMGDSLGFHIIFVLMGLTLPILVSWFEFKGIRSGNAQYLMIARFWSKIMALLVVTGVISGTIIAMQMSLVWPGILKFGGEVIGLPFMFETYAFLIEASFLALYMTTWSKVKPWLHWFFGIMVVIGSTMSAYAITSVNAWMNYPSGFDYIDGKITNVSVWNAMFSRTSLIEFAHSMPAYYLSATLIVVGMYALRQLHISKTPRRQTSAKDWVIIKSLMVFAAIMFVLIGITADLTGKYLAQYEPSKLAAIELNYQTRANAPLLVGGVGTQDGRVLGPHFEVPHVLSWLAGTQGGIVQGINETPVSKRPPLVVHTFFDIKMTLINILMVLIPGYFVIRFLRPTWLHSRPVLFGLAVSGPIAVAIVELGWMLTEIGRQPWAVRGYLTTEQAITQSHSVAGFAYLFPISYVFLFALTIVAIRKLVKLEAGKTL